MTLVASLVVIVVGAGQGAVCVWFRPTGSVRDLDGGVAAPSSAARMVGGSTALAVIGGFTAVTIELGNCASH